jgi:hypothetical protein
MACIESITNCVTQGNDWFLDVTLTVDGVFDTNDEPSNPINITGATVVLTFKEAKEGTTVITPTIAITDAVNGQISFSLTAAQTEGLIVAPSATGSRKLFGAPQITYQDGTVEDLFQLDLDIHQSWN